MAEDDEAAEEYLERSSDLSSRRHPSLEEWSPEVEYLAAVADRLGEVIQAIIATAPGGKPPKFKPLPRPKTAIDRAKDRKSRGHYEALVAEVKAAQERYAARRG